MTAPARLRLLSDWADIPAADHPAKASPDGGHFYALRDAEKPQTGTANLLVPRNPDETPPRQQETLWLAESLDGNAAS